METYENDSTNTAKKQGQRDSSRDIRLGDVKVFRKLGRLDRQQMEIDC